MAIKKIRIYNAVICPNSMTHNMLFTDKELEKMQYYERRDLLSDARLVKAKVYNTDVFYAFGRRFATQVKEYINF